MTKSNRTICRLILPFLFAVLLAAGVFVFCFSKDTANDDIAEDILRFDLLYREQKAAQVCAWSENGTDFYLFLPTFVDPDNVFFSPLHNSKIILDGHEYQKGDRLPSLVAGSNYAMTVSGLSAENLTLTVMQSSEIPLSFCCKLIPRHGEGPRRQRPQRKSIYRPFDEKRKHGVRRQRAR